MVDEHGAGPRAAAAPLRRRVVVLGRVQGVGFRASCAHRAGALAVNGWVRNRSDGSVEAVFEGPAPAVEAMVAWCRQGPPLAAVSRVDVSDEPAQGEGAFRLG